MSDRFQAFPDKSTCYLAGDGWRACYRNRPDKKSPVYRERERALAWLEEQREREKDPGSRRACVRRNREENTNVSESR